MKNLNQPSAIAHWKISMGMRMLQGYEDALFIVRNKHLED